MFKITKRLLTVPALKIVSILDPVVYYTRIGLSFVGQVAKHEIQLPDVGRATQGLSKLITNLTTAGWKNITFGEIGAYGKEGIKIAGFFLVGEMIGRGAVIGYQIEGTDSEGSHH